MKLMKKIASLVLFAWVLLASGSTLPCEPCPPAPLHYAAWSGNLSWMRHLLAYGASPNQPDTYFKTPLHFAAEAGHVDAVRLLLAAGAQVDAFEVLEGTPLTHAAVAGHADVVRLLLKVGADPNRTFLNPESQDCYEWGCSLSPLEAAAKGGHAEVVRILLQGGAHPFTPRDEHDREFWPNAFQHALLGNHPEAAWLLAERMLTSLERAAFYGSARKVRELLGKGQDPNEVGRSGCTPLHLAAWQGELEVVRILLQAGAQRNARCHKPLPNFTPVELAALGGWPDVVELLAKGGPEYRALQLAVYKRRGAGPAEGRSERSPDRPAVVRYLVEKLKTPVAAPKEYRGFTYPDPWRYRLDFEGAPLELAAKNGQANALALMLKSKPGDLDLSGPYGHWLLAKAATSGHLEVVRLLVEAGAPVNDPLSPELPSPALAEAVRSGHRHVVRYLLERGAKTSPDQVPERGRSYEWQGYGYALQLHPPLVEAAARGDLAMVRLLVKHGAWLGRYLTTVPLGWIDRESWTGLVIFDYYQVTPLEVAVHEGRLQVARYLVEKGAVPPPGLLEVAARQANPEMVRFVLGLKPGREERKRALAWATDADVVRLLLGADRPGKADIAGSGVPAEALYQAIVNKRHEALRTLLEAGANPNTRSEWGVPPDDDSVSPLFSAILNDDPVAARLLAINGATFKDEAERKQAVEAAGRTLKPYLAMIVANLTGRQELVCPAIERYNKHRLDAGEGIPMEFQLTSCL